MKRIKPAVQNQHRQPGKERMTVENNEEERNVR